ncbi:MAG: NYN domain-containing protein [Spirochaetaceae bacterium]|nr:NYN domain-containing protein [Spirochaetaceae bacterium]
MDTKLTRIGVFYDGSYFSHVSNYYCYDHQRRARISISGLHDFIREEVAKNEQADARYCRIVDAHYFRARVSAADAQDRDVLYRERVFEDVLINEGVTTHFLPSTPRGEKGIDVWFALEAFELAIYKKFNVVVLVAGDGDYVPLVRKLNTLGTRTMVTAWDFKTSGVDGQERETRASQFLINEVTYAVMMDGIIDDRSRSGDRVVNNLFVASPQPSVARGARPIVASDELHEGVIQNLKDGFGFITPDSGGENLFFHWRAVKNGDFDELQVGEMVLFVLGSNDRGPCALDVRRPDNPIAGG